MIIPRRVCVWRVFIQELADLDFVECKVFFDAGFDCTTVSTISYISHSVCMVNGHIVTCSSKATLLGFNSPHYRKIKVSCDLHYYIDIKLQRIVSIFAV